MKKSLIISIGMLFLLSSMASHTAAAPVDTNQVTTVEVALLSPQSGGLSAYTKGFEQAAQLAIEDLNDDASLNGSWEFSLTVYDTQTTPEGANAAITQAIADGAVYVVGAAGSGNTLSAASVAKSSKVPMISYASTSPALSDFEDDGFLWRTPPSDALQGQVIADLADSAGYEEMVIVTLENDYGVGLANSTGENFKDLGGTLLSTITYAETTVDFSTIVSQISAEEPDIIVAISYATDGSLLFVEMADQNVDVQVIGADGVADVGIFGESTGTAAAMEGFVTVRPSAVASAESTAFKASYAARFSNTTGDIYTGETYDAVFAGALAINASASTDGEDIIAALADLSWNGVTGPLSFDENGDSTAGFYEIMEVQGDDMVTVASWEPVEGLAFSATEFLLDWRYRNADTSFEPGTVTTTSTSESDEDDSPVNYTAVLVAIVVMSAVPVIRRRR